MIEKQKNGIFTTAQKKSLVKKLLMKGIKTDEVEERCEAINKELYFLIKRLKIRNVPAKELNNEIRKNLIIMVAFPKDRRIGKGMFIFNNGRRKRRG